MPNARNQRRRTLVWGALAAVGFAALVVAIVLAVNGPRNQVDDICFRIHRIVTVGASIIDGRPRLANQLKLGLINRAQYETGLEETKRALATWRTADCTPP